MSATGLRRFDRPSRTVSTGRHHRRSTVYRFNGTWTSLIDDRAFSAIKQGVGAVNELRVVTKGPNATFYVNDQKFDTISDKTVPGTSHVGLVVEAPKSGNTTFAFDDTVVHELTSP